MPPLKAASGALLAAALLFTGSAVPDVGQAEPLGEWLIVPPQSLLIDAGNPLDFSSLVPQQPAGSSGQLLLQSDGRLGFEATPDRAQRFNCAMLASGPHQEARFPTHAEADVIATQLRRHGYTLVRLHNTDYLLTRHADRSLAIDPEQLDRFHYLLAALKREGVSWMLDVLTQPATDMTAQAWSKGSSPDDLRVRIHFDQQARQKWLALVDQVFSTTNRYTGQSLLADPALAFVIGANENSIAFAAKADRPYPAGLDDVFDRWLHTNFDAAQLNRAIPDLTSAERAGTARIKPPANWDSSGERMDLFQRFISETEVGLYRWMGGHLAERGYRGPMLGYHEWYRGANNRTRSQLPIIDMHAYVGEVASQSAGAHFVLPSLTDDRGLGEMTASFSNRWLDRPMVFSEYGQPFPNPTRYESGLFYPALAAFQGFSTICRTAFLPVEGDIPSPASGSRPLRGYSVGLDPNERAQETLSALLFLRGDVSPATSTIAVPFGPVQFRQAGSASLPAEIKRAALIARLGLITPEKIDLLPPSTPLLTLGNVPFTLPEKLIDRAGSIITNRTERRLAELMASMRASGDLPADNLTDPAAGIFQSQTGQITLNQRAGTISVVTPRTEALSTTGAIDHIRLGNLAVESIDGGALLAASALDNLPLASSQKILFILTGDTTNTALSLNGSGINRQLVDWGRLPIMMRRVKAKVSLAGPSGGRLTVLALNGRPLRSTSFTGGRSGMELTLDIGAIAAQPTTFFLFERD
ncbi:hypothetical protein ACFOWT_11250 [Croceibacterium xixiisoli]|uniref:hypothetical protein n=1 Tax=Croceibacterium xixiisoli TaxID=1476466 RepID=UPI00136C239E|nr:hypothetical protein [Croceibacterium xixiisoli]